VKHVEREFAGRKLKLEAGRLAKQSAGSCLIQYGETVVLAAVTVSDNIANLPYFPSPSNIARRRTRRARFRAAS